MAAFRSGVTSGCLTKCFLTHTGKAGAGSRLFSERRIQSFLQRSQLHTTGEGRDQLTRAVLGRRHHGRFLLVSAVSIRHNSTQPPVETLAAASPLSEPPASLLIPTITPPPPSTAILSPPTIAPQPIAEPLAEAVPTALDVLQSPGAELTLSELGLGSSTPVGLVQNILEFMHLELGLPWWGAIVLGTVIARVVIFPVMVKGQREAAKLNNVMPEMTKLTTRMNEAKQSGNKFEFSKAYSDLSLFQKKNDVNPLRGFLVPLVQMPVFISFFVALRKMAYLPVPSMQTGGALWFMDLTAADPYYVLPLCVTATMFVIMELGVESGVDNPNLRAMKTVFRVMPFVILPLTMNFPTAVFTYWMTSNLFSLGQVALLRHPLVRKKLQIPEKIVHPASALPPTEGFIKTLKKGWKNAQLAHQLQEREKRITNHLENASKGPLRQTFTHNPLQQAASPIAAKQANQKEVLAAKRPWQDTIG